MTEFTLTCFRCGAEFTESLPRVFCVPCRPLAAVEAEERLVQFYLDNPDAPMPGDRVRRRTEDDRVFEAAVAADLAGL